jgi:hypothetical protein
MLGDPSFIPTLCAMAGGGFWRWEKGGEIAFALNAIGSPKDPEVVRTLLKLAGDPPGFHGTGAIGDFARRCTDKIGAQFIDRLRLRAGANLEVVHQLPSLGEQGIDSVLLVYEQLDVDHHMRKQIESYSVVGQRLGLVPIVEGNGTLL